MSDDTWPDGFATPGTRVWVPNPAPGSDWVQATFEAPGDPEEAVEVEDDRVIGEKRKSDVGLVRFDDGSAQGFRYEQIREHPPA